MALQLVKPVDEEIDFGEEEIIVSKTDLKGRIIYANDVFCRVAEMSTREVIGQPHNIIRHPDMPRAVFKLLWSTVQSGEEIFAFVKNMSKTGKYYWVNAHVTPSYDDNGDLSGYNSNRRYPAGKSIQKISPIYEKLLAEEKKHTNSKESLQASSAFLKNFLDEQNMSYAEFIWSLKG
ncbi:PUTATIVE SIGNAL-TRANSDUCTION SENSOR PROTEIN [hydrothermal vent metagenome]|uniref:PUTATIVE SIGNAL-TRANSDUCTION SENSOR PROTEIN n=1 Tax=hydrothermal vent metagenome TaxID=652676 RepID=A0A3B1BJ96_9ZZZZ